MASQTRSQNKIHTRENNELEPKHPGAKTYQRQTV